MRSHFFEWDKDRVKHTFTWDKSRTLYMAGVYNFVNNIERYVILTTAANESMAKVHDCMPLILPKNQIEQWIFWQDSVGEILKSEAPMLTDHCNYEQLSLF